MHISALFVVGCNTCVQLHTPQFHMKPDKFYGTAEWQKARKQALHDYDWKCTNCGQSLVGLGRAAHVHHRKELARAPALRSEPLNLKPLCSSCHNQVEPRTSNATQRMNRARPILPKPGCRVMLVCGPAGSGKSTYVEANKGPDDTVIDFDAIAKEMGFGRERGSLAYNHVGLVLEERNSRMRALARAPSTHTAWVVLLAPSAALRAWWCGQLNVAPKDMVLLKPDRDELERRIKADPTRAKVIDLHLTLAKQWFEKENTNNPGVLTEGCDENGNPLDPLHPWASSKVSG